MNNLIKFLLICLILNLIKINAINYNSGYLYSQYYEELNGCSSSRLTFSEGFALNICITNYNALGNPISSSKYTCDNQNTATIINYTSTNCEDSGTSYSFALDVCNNVTSSGLNSGISMAYRCILSNPAVNTNNLPIFMNSVVNIGYPDYDAGCNGNIITFTAMSTSICYNNMYNNQNYDNYSLLTCNDSYTLKSNFNSNNCSNLTSSDGYDLYNNDVCLIDNNLFDNSNQRNSKDICYFPNNIVNDDNSGNDDDNNNDDDGTYAGSYYYGYYYDDNDGDDDTITSSASGYVYYQYYDFFGCQGSIKKVLGYINNKCLLINELYIPALAISYSISDNSINMTQYSTSNCDETSVNSIQILDFNTCYREPNDGYYYKVFYSNSVSNADQVDNLPQTDQSIVLSGYKTSTCNSNILSFEAIPLNTCIYVSGESTSYEYSCDSNYNPVVTIYNGDVCNINDKSNQYNLETSCNSDNVLYDDNYELDVSIYSKITCNVPHISSSLSDSFFSSQLGYLVLLIAIVVVIAIVIAFVNYSKSKSNGEEKGIELETTVSNPISKTAL